MMSNIEWKRVAKPQADGYDSHVIASFLQEKYGWKKKTPACDYTLCDGLVAVRPSPYHKTLSDIINNNYEENNLLQTYLIGSYEIWNDTRAKNIEPYLRAWDIGHEMFKLFLDEYWPLVSHFYIERPNNKLINIDKNTTLENIAAQIDAHHMRGCSSGHWNPSTRELELAKPYMNAVYTTIVSHQGCVEGMYHEVGHLRLNALNLEIEKHDGRLFTNTSEELYESPIRRDKKRPMSAVIQAIYSWIIFGENDIQCAKIEGNSRESADYLIINLPKIEDGLATIRQHIKCTPEGKDFFDGYLEWGEDVCDRGRALCKEEFGKEYETRYNTACLYKVNQPVPQ